jgi:hypothetical protein
MRIIDVYKRLFSADYDRLSEMAWNGNYILDETGDPRAHSAVFGAMPWLTFRLLGLGLSCVSVAIALGYAWARPGLKGALVAAAYQAFAFWALPVGTHDRYLYPFIALLLPVAVIDRRWLWFYVPLSATLFANLIVVAPPVHSWMGRWVSSPFTVYVAAFNMAMFIAFTAVLASESARLAWRLRRRRARIAKQRARRTFAHEGSRSGGPLPERGRS